MWRSVSTILIAAILSASCGGSAPGARVARIRQRGFLVCGVFPGIAGFAQVDGQGHYTGFDIDFCRAVAAAIVGSAERIRYQQVPSIDLFERSNDIDIVSRRLTWSLRREGMARDFWSANACTSITRRIWHAFPCASPRIRNTMSR
jgi:general L-amino acid transport system substrate-binding protein